MGDDSGQEAAGSLTRAIARAAAFGPVLTELRRGQGFRSAYAFYRARDGRRTLGLSFSNYLRLERGRSLPKPWRLAKILDALDLPPMSREADRVILAYLRSVLGSDELLRRLSPQLEPDPSPASWTLAEAATRQAIEARKAQLTLDQYRVLARDPVAYACHVILANTAAWVAREDLARVLSVPVKGLTGALQALRAADLLKVSNGSVRSPLAGRFVAPPAPTRALASVYLSLQRHREELARARGRPIHSSYLVLRATRPSIARFVQHLSEIVHMSAIFGSVEPKEGSALFVVEGRVTELFGDGQDAAARMDP